MRQKQTILKLMLLLALVLWSSGTAWAVTTTYKIVNNSGVVVLHVKGTSNKPLLPDKMQSPYAKNYRYYQYEADARNDAQYGAAVAAASYGAKQLDPSLNLSYSGDVFVRYDYDAEANVKDEAGNTVRIDGAAAYNMTICLNNRYIYYNSESTIDHSSLPSGIKETILVNPYNTAENVLGGDNPVPDEKKKLPAYQWRFVGQRAGYEGSLGRPDPYDIRIINVSDGTKVLTGIYTRSYQDGPTNQQYIHLTNLAPDNVATHIQRFFIRKRSNTVQIAACAPLYLYLSGGNKDMWFVFNKEAAEPKWITDANSFKETDCYQALHMRLHTKQEDAKQVDNGSELRSTIKFYRQETRKYVILDNAGNKVAATKASIEEMSTRQVPAAIASALPGTTYTYYSSKADAISKTNAINSDSNLPDVIYVRYEFNASDAGNQVKLDGSKSYNMTLGGSYVKYQEGAGDDSDVTVGSEEDSDADEYVWLFKGGDPYKIQLTSAKTGAGYITGESIGSTISLHTGNKTAALKSNATASGHVPSTYYLVKSPAYTNENPVYLLRASYVGEGATSDDSDDDANLYTWAYGGDASDWNESRPRLYSSAYIEDANEAVQMYLEELLGSPVTYHIVDRTKHEDVISHQSRKIPLQVPAAIKSPLVSQFYYYDTFANAQTDNRSTGIISSTTSDADANIFVTYDVGTDIFLNVPDAGGEGVRYKDRGNGKDVIRFGTFYVMKFLNGQYYQQEDGSNGITTETKKAEVPYSNGDACMNVYDEAFTNKKLQGGGSERTRMPWAFIGGDPYRLKVSAYQMSHKLKVGSSTTISDYNWYFSYFRTYYNETLGKVITTNVTDDPLVTTHVQFGNSEAVPTEYMVLGTKGKYKLVTTKTIDDGATDDHRTVNTFEQYWKNYETIGQKLGTYETINDVKVVTSMPSDVELQARGWHKYPAWAYSKPLDGAAKEYDYQNHWYQTFDMGDEFDLIEVSLEPSIVLLDNHGWEIFRHPLTDKPADKNFIETYNSPMVKAYHWYKKGDKVTGYHKYVPSDPAISESGEEEYTSTSLIDYPSDWASNPGDWYVTYEVKDEYKYLYDDNNGSPISAPCLIGNDSKWATAGTGTIGSDNTVSFSGDDTNLTISGTITDAMLWYLKPNPTIDTEMGYTGSAITYKTQQKGFDPYNIQIRNDSQYFKTNATSATFNDQEWYGNGTSVALGTSTQAFTATGADGVTVKPTNATFMALNDRHGNMRFVPRFDHLQAVTNLTSGSPELKPWVYDTLDVANTSKDDSLAMQKITLQPVQKYKFEVRDVKSSDLVVSSLSTFYARPGASLMTTLGDVSVPLPRELIRSYCDYPAAYTSYDSGENTYSNEVTCYPPGDGSGISSDGVKIYVPYYVEEGLFAASADVANPSWYNIAFNTKNQFIQANTSTHAVSGSGTQTATNSKWAFVGSPYDLKVFNQAERAAGFLKVNGSATCLSAVDENNHWTLLYNDNGNPIMRLKDTGTYIKINGATQAVADYPAGADFKIFLTNLVTVTYHVYHKNSDNSWAEDYTESVDYLPNQLDEYSGLPASVTRPLCEYKYFKTSPDMQAGDGYTTFSDLYTTLDATAKVSNMDIYLSYEVHYPTETAATAPVKFFATEEEARNSKEWSFLMQGVESAAVVYGQKNNDYGHENARLGMTPRTYGEDVAGLTPAEQTFPQFTDITVLAGFHFIRRTSALNVNASTGAMTVPAGTDTIGVVNGTRYIPSQNKDVDVYMMSPLNDFRRIAETYKDGNDTGFREDSWLWAFIGTPYKFEIVNREAVFGDNHYKRLAQVRAGNGVYYVRLVANTEASKRFWTLEQLDNYGDAETTYSFHIKAFDEDKILSREKSTTMDLRVINTPPTSDIAYLKSTAFMAYPWNWSDTKYKTVTVNIYKGSVSGSPVLTKTYTPADRAFVAGDVIDGTDGHFYLPLAGTADGTTWKEKGVVNKTMPYDNHLINIPYELRRRFCSYTVASGDHVADGKFTVGDENTTQTVDIVYTVQTPPEAPYFVPESDLAIFRSTAETGNYNGVLKKDYYYFLDLKNTLSQYYYINKKTSGTPTYQGVANDTRFTAQTPDHAKFYFVGDPYSLRVCNVFTDTDAGSSMYLEQNTTSHATSMSTTATEWELVDANTLGSNGYDATASEVKYRLDYLLNNGNSRAFALRTKGSGSNPTYRYFGKDGKTYRDSIYVSDGTPQMNQLAAFRDYPDSRHLANSAGTVLTVMRPVTLLVSVYDHEEPTKLVTKNEESDFYAMTERFKGVPNNLQRNYCRYTWASSEAVQSNTNNQLTADGYFVIPNISADRHFSLYAKYVETDDSPFSRLDENGIPVRKNNALLSPWFNMSIGSRWAFFNSNLTGSRYEINGQTTFNTEYANKPNNSELTFPYGGSSLPNANASGDRFRKGLHWALVGDPYNFQLRCQRDIIDFTGTGDDRTPVTDESGNYVYHSAYIKGAPVDDATGTVVPSISTKEEATWWTWIRERSTNRYFLSESLTRRTEVTASAAAAAKANAPRRLPIDYPQPDPSVNPPAATLNFKINTEATYQGISRNQGIIDRGNNYGVGDEMRLLSVDDVDANNECFDANVTVYNKINDPVATSGWEEYARYNVKGNGRISTDVQRWGCTYHYWADETMTRYPFTSFSQKDENGRFLIQDKGTVYVTYDYDESLYSSENEYRWMNLFYNWDKNTVDDPSAETPTVLYAETKEGWIYSPATGDATSKAMCDQTTQSTDKEQKWAMIGDPYKFILYNYNRKKDADAHNAYYLYYDGTIIRNKNFTGADEFNETTNKKETKQGIYFTWKVDGTNFQFVRNDGTGHTESYQRAGLPESFFNFNGAGANHVQTGYLAICDMEKTSLTDQSNLLGSIVGYTTFDETAAEASQYMKTTPADKRFLVMPMQERATTVTFHLDPTIYTDGTVISDKSKRDFSTNPVFDYTTRNFGVDNTITLPWMMRRQYCDYTFYLIEADSHDPTDTGSETYLKVDAMNYEDNSNPPTTHRSGLSRVGDYATFWHDGSTSDTPLASNEIPSDWNGKHVYIRVTYQPTADFVASTNTGATTAEKAASVKWMNVKNQEKGNMLQYTHSQKVTGNSKENGENATNDLLWAVEGDPYGFKLHNRYAVAGNGTELNPNWSTVLTTDKVNSTEKYSYLDGVDGSGLPRNSNFTYDENGDPVIKSALRYGAVGTADAFGTMSTTTTNAVYEAMTGNYDGAMLIHPVNACINVRNDNGYKYYGAFLFNGAPTDYPVQLNYLQEWEAMRNVYANWRLERPTGAQLYPYYQFAGFVGGLQPAIAANTSFGGSSLNVPDLFGRLKNGTATTTDIDNAMALVTNPDNLVPFTSSAHYRLRGYASFDSNAQVQDQLGGHYVSGYLHKLEKTFEAGGYRVPLHFYERAGQSKTLDQLGLYYGNEWATGFENRIEIMDPEYDPSSIFQMTSDNGGSVMIETQGMVLHGKLGELTLIDMPTGGDLATQADSIHFELQNVGQAAFQIRMRADSISGKEDQYLSYSPNGEMKYMLYNGDNEFSVYEGAHGTHIHGTKWMLEPVGTTSTNAAGTTYQRPLKVKLSHMGSNDYFTSVCFPFDVTLPYGAYAYSCQGGVMTKGDEQEIGGQKYHQLNIVQIAGEDMAKITEGKDVRSSSQVIPAGVPALLYVDGSDTSENKIAGGINGGSGSNTVIVPLTLGGEYSYERKDGGEYVDATEDIVTSMRTGPLKYSYLTGELTNEEITGDELVFVFGKFSGKLGFMRNANIDYTGVKNNRFLLHNKIYYLYDPTPSGSSANFVTVGFGEGLQIPNPVVDGVEEVIAPADVKRYEHDAIYDLQGRRVPRITQPGIYIINGRKVAVKRVNMD